MLSYEKSVFHPRVHTLLDLPVMSLLPTLRHHIWVPCGMTWVIFLSFNMLSIKSLFHYFCFILLAGDIHLPYNQILWCQRSCFLFLIFIVLLMQKPLSSNWHISLKIRMVLFGKRKLNVLVSFTAHWCLKWKNRIGWLLSSIAFQFYSVSHFTLADCVLTFLPWKGKSPNFSQYWKLFPQHLNRPIHRS